MCYQFCYFMIYLVRLGNWNLCVIQNITSYLSVILSFHCGIAEAPWELVVKVLTVIMAAVKIPTGLPCVCLCVCHSLLSSFYSLISFYSFSALIWWEAALIVINMHHPVLSVHHWCSLPEWLMQLSVRHSPCLQWHIPSKLAKMLNPVLHTGSKMLYLWRL